MRKFAVMVLAIMLVGVSSCADAYIQLDFFDNNNLYVGKDVKVRIEAIPHSSYTLEEYDFTITEGSLPPGCSLEQDVSYTAYIQGTPTIEGTYPFTVYVQARGRNLDLASKRWVTVTDDGYARCVMKILPATNTSDDTPPVPEPEPTPEPDSSDIPAPAPDPEPSKDIPVPNPKPESVNVIAEKLGTNPDSVSYIASSNMAAPQAPTERITNALDILGLEVISTQGSLNVTQSGYYAFPLTVPASLVGTDTELRVYLADRSVFGESSFSESAVTSSLTPATIFTEVGGTVTILPGTIIAAANL